jgi:putative nucleotidyltransferase with HDIG domain
MAKNRILVVEDESIVARDVRNMLIGLGYEVAGVVPSGEEAVEKARETQPDLALVDVILQGEMSGVEAADIIYSHFNIPVVYLTAYADETTLQRAKETEPFGYLLKPFEERELQTTIETRDPYTAGHQRRVTKLACAIAEEMNLSKNQTEGVRLAGGLHDLGKIYVPAEILAKPGKLTPVEYNIIKTHPQVGYDILKSIEFPWPIAKYVLQHHERIDGTGYPEGLRGEDIFLEARILAVADVIEAMATHRPYRAALTIEAALDEITSGRGEKYDIQVVDACLRVFKNKKFAFD